MKKPSALALGAFLVLASITVAGAADRVTKSFGKKAPSAKEVEAHLFPEAECDDPTKKHQCLAVRPSTERAVGVDVKFHTGSAELTPEARAQLEGMGKAIAARMSKLSPGELVIEGHADPRGSDSLNKRLSAQRAGSVANYLVSTHGVDPKILRMVGRGSTHLLDPAHPASQINRRVELVRAVN